MRLMQRKHPSTNGRFRRRLRFEGLEQRLLMAADLDDAISEATTVQITTSGITVAGKIDVDTDVDMYRINVGGGYAVVDIDIDTPQNGPGGLGSFVRLFDVQGNELAFNNDATAPGETQLGFDAYLRFTFKDAGAFYIGVSNANNTL